MTFREPGPASILGVLAVGGVIVGAVAWSIVAALVDFGRWALGW